MEDGSCILVEAGVLIPTDIRRSTAYRNLIFRIGVDRNVMLCLELHGACLLVRRVGVDCLSLKVLGDGGTALFERTAGGSILRMEQRRTCAKLFFAVVGIGIVGIFAEDLVIIFLKSEIIVALGIGTNDCNNEHDDQDHCRQNHQQQDTRNTVDKLHIGVQLLALVSTFAQNVVHGDRRFGSHGVSLHGGGVVLQDTAFVLRNGVDAANGDAVGIHVCGGVIRCQHTEDGVVLGDGIGFAVNRSDDRCVLVNRCGSALAVHRCTASCHCGEIGCNGSSAGACLHGVAFHEVDVVSENFRRIALGKQNRG